MTHKIRSRSPNRDLVHRTRYISEILKNGKSLDDPGVIATLAAISSPPENYDPEWEVNNLGYDLISTDWILEKVRGDKIYAQHIYAALCNNDWQKREVWLILKNDHWHCSWRHAGALVADMLGEGDYMDWYCSGITNGVDFDLDGNYVDLKADKELAARVAEGIVTDEVRSDFLKLGWHQFYSDEDDQS